MVHLEDFYIVVITQDTGSILHELKQHVHRRAEIRSKYAGKGRNRLLKIPQLFLGKARRTYDHRHAHFCTDSRVLQGRFRRGKRDYNVGISGRGAPNQPLRNRAVGLLLPGLYLRLSTHVPRARCRRPVSGLQPRASDGPGAVPFGLKRRIRQSCSCSIPLSQ